MDMTCEQPYISMHERFNKDYHMVGLLLTLKSDLRIPSLFSNSYEFSNFSQIDDYVEITTIIIILFLWLITIGSEFYFSEVKLDESYR